MTKMTTKKKIEKGFMKERTLDDVTKDYNTECFLQGHKARLLKQYKKDCEALEKEITEHLEKSIRFNQEGMALQKKEQEAKAQTELKEKQAENVSIA